MKKKEGSQTMTSLLREAIANAENIRAIERATGVPHCSLIRFRDGADLKLASAERLADHFGIGVHWEKEG